jgi:hypothetical protein
VFAIVESLSEIPKGRKDTADNISLPAFPTNLFSPGFLFSDLPIIRKVHKTKEEEMVNLIFRG